MFSKFAPVWVSASRRSFTTIASHTSVPKDDLFPEPTLEEELSSVKSRAAARAASITKDELLAYEKKAEKIVSLPSERELEQIKALPEFVCLTPKGYPVVVPSASVFLKQYQYNSRAVKKYFRHSRKSLLNMMFFRKRVEDPISFYNPYPTADEIPKRGTASRFFRGFLKYFTLFVILPYIAARITHPHLFAQRASKEEHVAAAH